MSFVVGLTGGIGCGKSAAADLFAAHGAALVDTDAIAHALTAPGGAAMPAIRQAFGADMLTAEGALDRTTMRRLAFADPQQRHRLEAILHPLIRAEAAAQIRRPASPTGISCGHPDFSYVVLVVPLLVETGAYREALDRILVIDCPVETQIQRVMARNGMARPEVEAIIAAQATRQARCAIADDVILNDAGLAMLAARVTELHARYAEMAQSRSNFTEMPGQNS